MKVGDLRRHREPTGAGAPWRPGSHCCAWQAPSRAWTAGWKRCSTVQAGAVCRLSPGHQPEEGVLRGDKNFDLHLQ